jgi:hypothetical protein
MSCKDYKYLIEAFVEGTIDDSGLETLQEHVKTCPACRKECEDFSKLRCFVEEAFVSATSPTQAAEAVKAELSSSASMPGANRFGNIPIGRKTLAAASVLLICGIGIGFGLGRNAGQAEVNLGRPLSIDIASVEGTVLVKHAQAKPWEELTPASSVFLGDLVHTVGRGTVVLSIAEDSSITIGPDTVCSVNAFNGESEFSLARGRIEATLESPHPPFFINTPQGRLEALGTEFIVEVK